MISNKTVFSNDSLLNILTDSYNVESGTVTNRGTFLEFGPNSSATFTIDTNNLSASKLKIVPSVSSSDVITSRYNNNLHIKIKITYEDESVQYNTIMPYSNEEERGQYSFDMVELEARPVYNILVTVSYKAYLGALQLNKLQIFKDVTDSLESFNSYLSDYVSDAFSSGTIPLVIPLVDELPDINQVPDGYICRLSTMEAQ